MIASAITRPLCSAVCPTEATPELVGTLEDERDRMSRRIEHLTRNRDAIETYLDGLPRAGRG